jgi:hypothetical protein
VGEHPPECRLALFEAFQVPIVGDFLAHVPPHPLNGVQVRAVWWQENEFNPGGCKPSAQLPCVVVSYVVEDYDDFWGKRVVTEHLFEVFFEGVLVSTVCETHRDLPGLAVDAAKPCLAFPFALLANRSGLLPALGPLVARGSRVRQRELVLEKQNGVRAFGREFFLKTP